MHYGVIRFWVYCILIHGSTKGIEDWISYGVLKANECHINNMIFGEP